MAYNLYAQGRHGEAQPLFERALAIWRQALGEDHPNTAECYNSVAANLAAQGRHREAQPLFERALAIRRNVLGEDHPVTAKSYNFVAENFRAQQRFGKAQPLYERALEIRQKESGEGHADTAASYHNLAANLAAQGRYGEAQPLFERALVICRKALGEHHRDTAIDYNDVAANLYALGRYTDAEKNWSAAAAVFDDLRGRFGAAAGLTELLAAVRLSPLPSLACILARRGAALEAWKRFEQNLARGLLDDLSARHARRISDPDRAREQQFLARLKRLDTLITHARRREGRPGTSNPGWPAPAGQVDPGADRGHPGRMVCAFQQQLVLV